MVSFPGEWRTAKATESYSNSFVLLRDKTMTTFEHREAGNFEDEMLRELGGEEYQQ